MEKRLYAHMQRNAEELEQHVAERTAELSLANEQLQREIAERKQVEETLRRYEHIVSATPDLMALLDTHYVYQAVNDTYLKAYRKSRDEIIGHYVRELVGADIFESLLKKHLDRCLKGIATNYEAWLTYPGRGRRFMSVSYYPYCDAQQTVIGIVVSARDITELKRVEEALRRSEAKYRAIFAASPDFIFLTDVTGRFLEANPAFLKWAGLSPEELQQRYFMHFFAGERVEKIQTYVAKIKSGQEVRMMRVSIKNTRGEILESEMDAVPLQENGEVTVVLNVARDVTERVRAEQALREGEEKYRALFEASTDAILLVTLDGHVVDCNATACKMYGYVLDDLIGLTVTDLVSEEMAAMLPEVTAEVLSVGSIRMEANARRKDGSHFPVEVSTRIATLGGKRLVVIYVRDVSDRAQIEKALQETMHQLKAALQA
jgi:PAS domain S-box-containing protein